MPFLKVTPPNLPIATDEYDRIQQEMLTNVLRLYFNRLNGDLAALAEVLGGSQISIPTALYYSSEAQTAASTDTAYPVDYNNIYFESGLTLDSGDTASKITVTKPGIYNFQFTGQLLSSNSSAKEAQVWIRKNGTNIDYSARIFTVDVNGKHVPITWNFNIDMTADDYVQIMWGTDDTDLGFDTEAASAPYPAHASAVLSVNFVSSLEGMDIATAP